MKTTRIALAAAASMFAISAASAADLGGNCCADLEERIAELEATTARKGTRKVSLTISGFVGHNILFWDDGKVTDMYIGDGGNYFSRFRFKGEAKIRPDLTAGFTYEFGINGNNIGSMSQIQGPNATGSATGSTAINGDDQGYAGQPLLRDSTIYIRSDRLGMIKLGQGSSATDNLVLIDLGGMGGAATPDTSLYIGGFRLRDNAGNFSTQTWQDLIRGHESWDTNRRNHLMYETPTLHGFNVQVAVAEDNYWDIALRFANEWNGVRVAFGIGYQEDTEFNNSAGQPAQGLGVPAGFECANRCDLKAAELKGSASILHVPTGLFLTAAAGQREWSGADANGKGAAPSFAFDSNFWYLAGGVSRNFFGVGKTVLFAEYAENADFFKGDSKVTQWGLGFNQWFDNAALEWFVTYKNFSYSGSALSTTCPIVAPATSCTVPMGKGLDLDVVMTGLKMSF